MRRTPHSKDVDIAMDRDSSDNIVVTSKKTAQSRKRKAHQVLDEEVTYEPSLKKRRPNVQSKLTDLFTPRQQGPMTSPRKLNAKTNAPVSSSHRTPLQELTPGQFANKLRGPIGWCERPLYDDAFRAQFLTAAPNSAVTTKPAEGAATLQTYLNRPKRQSTLMSYNVFAAAEDESEDELIEAPKTAKRKSVSKRKSTTPLSQPDSDDDFKIAEDFASSQESEESDEASDDESPMISVDESEESEVPRKKNKASKQPKHQAKSTGVPNSVARTTVKSKPASAKGKATEIENLARMQTRKKDPVKGVDTRLPPISETEDIFKDLTKRALQKGLDKALTHLQGRPLRVATMCSGTESPLLALQMIEEALSALSPGARLGVVHLFSAEIVPFKQAYIERNFNPPIIFRDITELTAAVNDELPMATTAYGGKVAIPKDVDIVIAGTSCVDFSRLNKNRKGLEDGGESGDTWKAVLSFCRAFRPSIVLLENVLHADWATMLLDYENIDYESCGALVDTKDYYVPQTRQRGYMACFDKKKLASAGVCDAKETWQGLMSKLKRYASAPASAFLLPNDQVARQHLRVDEPVKEVDWSQCQMRHIAYRETARLGTSRPVTNWSESGSMMVPDNGHAAWYRKQVERVKDLIDGATIRKALPANGMFDVSYKTRLWDVSQNIDREEDNRPFGIVGCITPSGQYFATDAGRALIAAELLRLQGLPLEKISFTTETAAEIQDLAGNAMSTPVIGTSIIAALIAGHKMLDTTAACADSTSQHAPTNDQELILSDVENRAISTGSQHIDMRNLHACAERALRRCYCEGAHGMASKSIQQCASCGHTTCIACGGNPQHEYRTSPILSNARLPAAEFEAELKSSLALQLAIETGAKLPPLTGNQDYQDMVKSTLSERFSFEGVRRTSCWAVIYRSFATGSELNLVLGEGKPEWRLYARVPKSLPGNHILRRLLEKPIATACASESFFGTQWRIRDPDAISNKTIKISGSGAQIASWWCRNEVPDFAEHFIWEYLNIEVEDQSDTLAQRLTGKYEYLPKCGTASSGLFRKIGDRAEDRTLFLFLDPTRTGDPKYDRFVFSYDIARKEYDEVRQVIASLAPSWRPWPTNGKSSSCEPQVTTTFTADEWYPISKHALYSPPVDLSVEVPKNATELVQSSTCSQPAVLLSCEIPSGLLGKETSQSLQQVERNLKTKYAWMLEAMRRHLLRADWKRLENDTIDHSCNKCVPPRPSLRWSLGDNGSIVPYEDPAAAATYERAIKSRPKAFYISASHDKDRIRLNLVANIESLAQRAGAKLPKGLEVEYRWRLISTKQQPFAFRPFKLKSTTGVNPYEKDLGMSVKLFPKQKLALSWMRKQEAGVRFSLEQIEEETVKDLPWGLEVEAKTHVEVRGGICADHPGFGKTITSLALIQAQLMQRGQDGIIADIAQRQQSNAPGLIPLAATLIVCPTTLVKQWVDENEEKLGYRGADILCIKTLADLSKTTFAQFKSAKIIFVNRSVLAHESYTERLAAFAAIPGPATKSGRSFAHWLEVAYRRISGHLRMLQQQTPNSFKRHIESTYKANITSEQFSRFVPSRRLRGAGYVANKDKQPAATGLKAASVVDTTHIRTPLFEQFYFNRLIVDEFHQYEAKEYAAITALKADKRWGLSGTPAMGDIYELALIGGVLGVPLRIGSDAKGVMKATNARELKKDMTNFELFDSMRQPQSDSTFARIWEHGQAFLDEFARQNVMDFDELVFHERLAPVTLELNHHALSIELSQQLISEDMRIKKKSKKKQTDRERRALSVIASSDTAEEALSRFAANLDESHRNAIPDREGEIEQILNEVPNAILGARTKEPEAYEQWTISQLKNGGLGDKWTISKIKDLTKVSLTTSAHKIGEVAKEGERTHCARLNNLCKRLVGVKRSLRFLENVHLLHQDARSGEEVSACDFPGCGEEACISPNAAVSASCGHFVCRSCYDKLKHENKASCRAAGCRSAMHEYQLFWTKKMGSLKKSASTSRGAKIETAVQLLQRIEDQGDQAILFVQYENQLQHVRATLEARDIPAVVVEDNASAGNQIAEFRASAGKSDQKTVIVLNASSETAAGSNLQCANHVIFLSPLLRDSQYGYDSTMAQAIGRVRRHGQQKEIHVYRIVALDTIDVDILEHRERRAEALTEQGQDIDAPPALRALDMNSEPKKEKVQLVRENGHFSLRPRSWLMRCGADEDDTAENTKMMGKNRVLGWEDFSSLVKFSGTFTENDED